MAMNNMNTPEYFQLAEDYACYRPVGQVSFPQAIELVSTAIEYSRDNQIRKLLVDTTELTGFHPPTTLERFELGERCAIAAKGAVKVALVARPEMLDPERFGVTVARNRGMLANAFDSESEAMEWLMNSSVD